MRGLALLWSLGLAFGVGLALQAGCESSYPRRCAIPLDCPYGQLCDRGFCRDICRADVQCLPGERCEVSTGYCVARSDGGGADVPMSRCGDGKIDPGEACDGAAFGGHSCRSLGLGSGALRCTAICQLDKSGCQGNTARCGDQKIDPGEACDGAYLNGLSCQKIGFHSGTLLCARNCQLDLSRCRAAPRCNDGRIDPGESCDGVDLGGFSCVSLGYLRGTLRCSPRCEFDVSSCARSPQCGNGRIDNGEQCDGSLLGGQTCVGLGFPGGELRCTGGCRFDTSGCSPKNPRCGNGVAEGLEDCDGADLKQQSCRSRGFVGGTLGCKANCQLDTSGCTSAGAFCGDDNAQGSEQCDGADLRGQSCQSFGFTGGVLKCTGQCLLDKSSCTTTRPPQCGNGKAEGSEACDGADLRGQSCQSKGFAGGTLGCVQCNFDTSGCTSSARCGDGKAEGSEACDGADLRGQSCQSKGFAGGTLKCGGGCQFDTSGCTSGPATQMGQPCTTGSCGAGLVCIRFPNGKSYCTQHCSSSQPCPKLRFPVVCGYQLSGGKSVCSWGTKDKNPPICGDGYINGGEDCEGTGLWATCKGLGFSGGTLKCSNCLHDTSGCTGTNRCPNLPAHFCAHDCKKLLLMTPTKGPGYEAFHGSQWSYVRRDLMTYIQYAAASVSCVFPNTVPIGIGDISNSTGGTPRDSDGSLRHPSGSHVDGRDADIAYYQIGATDNRLRPVCPHTSGGRDVYHCTGAPNKMDAKRSAFLIAKLLESGVVRILGVDGKIGPVLKAEIQSLYNDGYIAKKVYDIFNNGKVTWETVDRGNGWYRFHHHHFHISLNK